VEGRTVSAAEDRSSRLIASDSDDRRKRLGQYFTGVDTARLLAELADARTASSVIDPMVGSGDMLAGSLEAGAAATVLAGIEIDPIAHETATDRLAYVGRPDAVIVQGDAFSVATLSQLPTLEYDLVITNPPYIRYQSGARAASADVAIPNATAVREGLIGALDMLPALDDTDRRIFKALARGYSGLADIAVPSWILCAALVAPGGKLAMLVPDTWLSRNYAHPVQYLLGRFFDIKAVVADRDAAWFSEALVRTTLVVAERAPRRASGFNEDGGHVRFSIGASSRDERSLVGAVYPSSAAPDAAFAADALRWSAKKPTTPRELNAEWVEHAHTAHSLKSHAAGERWVAEVEDGAARTFHAQKSAAPPLPLRALIARDVAFTTLEELGWRTGQGLRTGANLFFYVEREADGRLKASERVGGTKMNAPDGAALPVIRKQNELPPGYRLDPTELSGRVLVLDGYALPDDITNRKLQSTVGKTLAAHIRAAATTNLGTEDEPKLIPTLSAVAPNARPFDPDKPNRLPRFWYQLPSLTDRHRPALFVARINYGHPKTLLNPERSLVVDANFSTLWPTSEDAIDLYAVLSILNSAWCAAALETGCTVMGGGALKVEAAHLRRMAIPKLRRSALTKLAGLGRKLADADAASASPVLKDIDRVVFSALVGAKDASRAGQAARELASARRLLRSPSTGSDSV
jgi:predicted RNA methylase